MNFLHKLRQAALELLFLAGLFAACWGIWLIYQPAGFIAGGAALSAVSVIEMLGGENDELDKRH